ncbi:MAG: hypothetical protein R3Y59_06860 [bacterium]
MFIDIFPDYDTFQSKLITSPLFNENGVWTGCSEQTFQLLYNRYQGSHVSMSDTSFVCQFSNTLYEHFERFEYDISIKKEAREVSNDTWGYDGYSIANTAESPNEIGDTDSTKLNSLDRQNKTIVKDGISRVLYKKSDHNRAYYVKRFLDYFKYLFIKVLNSAYMPVWVSDDDDNLIE